MKNDFDFSKLQLLYKEYGQTLRSPDAEKKQYSSNNLREMGGLPGVDVYEARIKRRETRELFLNDIPFQIESDVLMETPSHCGAFIDIEDYTKISKKSSESELKDTEENFELKAESFKEVAQLLKASVFPEDAEQQLETKGFVVVKVAHRGYSAGDIVRETRYRELAAVTLEKLALLDEVAAFYMELHEMALAELKVRETAAPAAAKALTQEAKNLIKEGHKRKMELEKACAEYTAERTCDNRHKVDSARDIFNALQAQYADLYHRLFKIDTHAKLQEFPTLSDEAWHVLHQV